MTATVTVPQSVEDLEKLLCERLAVTPEQFRSVFSVEQKASDDFLVQQRSEWIDREAWIAVNDVVREQKGTWDSASKQWTIPYTHGTESEATYKQVRSEIPTHPKATEPLPVPDFAEGKMTLEELKASESQIGQIFPVIKDQYGNILDGFHRKRINPNWKETKVEIVDELQGLRVRIHANTLRRSVPWSEKHKWVMAARKLLNPENPMEPSQKEVADALGMSQQWVSKHDEIINDGNIHEPVNLPQRGNVAPDWKEKFLGYNVWGFKDENWRKHVAHAPPDMPDKEFYHGTTPPFVIHQLIKMFNPKTVLDSMAGVGTTGYVCNQYDDIECDLFDLYLYPKHNVQQADAEFVENNKKYDLIFNHIPYLRMVRYGDSENDLSTYKEQEFFEKLKRIIKHNHELLNDNGIYAILAGDWRHKNQIIPLMAKVTMLGLQAGFKLYDEAITLTTEQKSSGLQEYRAAKHGYLAQTFDMILIFRKVLT